MPDRFNGAIRPAKPSDLATVTGIYGHYVKTSTASFETDPPAVDEIFARWSSIRRSNLPYLVAEDADGILGYAYAAPYRARSAYRFTVEDSIYICPSHTQRGVGYALLSALIEECSRTGFQEMIGIIGDTENIGSIRLHQRCGFRHVGTLSSVGLKFDRWVDTVIMQRPLAHAP